jgi:formyltetrahydrofolate-dependent phosphoribosylglycinamide formyltransferase
MKRLAVFISGNGSNLQAIIKAIRKHELEAQIVVVVSNREKAYGLTRARRAGIPTLYFPFKPYQEAQRSREAYDADLAARVAAYKPDLIVLAGWMHILSAAFLDRFPERVINLHPALPGQFPGMHAIERAYESFLEGAIESTGVMVHQVVPKVDAGPVIVQEEVPIYADDSLDELETRIHTTEHQLIVAAIRQIP